MGLSSALASAMSGLRANQAALSIVSSNVANSQTPGYVVQTPNQIEVTTGDFGSTAMTTGVSRELDTYVQNQLRTETGGSGYADQMANILKQLQNVYGTRGNSGTLETTLDRFTASLQALLTSVGASSAQTMRSARRLARQLNVTTNGIQLLRPTLSRISARLREPPMRRCSKSPKSTPSFRACPPTILRLPADGPARPGHGCGRV